MAQTRVDLKHLLEDIRDSYPVPVEEAILTELIANALDSGCSEISITALPAQGRMVFADNGSGMSRKSFEQYHDIASTSKVRGRGIGFAGVGAKLALLVCRDVYSETQNGRTRLCSRWWLEDNFRAPWEDAPALGLVDGESGTAVRMNLLDGKAANLLAEDYLRQAVRTHFYPPAGPAFRGRPQPRLPERRPHQRQRTARRPAGRAG